MLLMRKNEIKLGEFKPVLKTSKNKQKKLRSFAGSLDKTIFFPNQLDAFSHKKKRNPVGEIALKNSPLHSKYSRKFRQTFSGTATDSQQVDQINP